MPTSCVLGFVLPSGTGGGAEASYMGSQVPWRAAVGNKVRLVCFARFRRRVSVAGVARSMGYWPLFASPHGEHYIRLLFAMSSEKFRLSFAIRFAPLYRVSGRPPKTRPPDSIFRRAGPIDWTSAAVAE